MQAQRSDIEKLELGPLDPKLCAPTFQQATASHDLAKKHVTKNPESNELGIVRV